jgi:hypothetical protein
VETPNYISEARSNENAILRFSPMNRIGTQKAENAAIDPFEYPLDGLILYYLTVIHNDIMIHASGVSYAGKGFLFSGVSGKGKSTMAGLWNDMGAKVIHDDRLIIRKTADGYKMFNTPVYDNDYPLNSPLDRIYIIEHGAENKLIQLKEASAVSQVLANCIQHAWDAGIVARTSESISEICIKIPTSRLLQPAKTIDHI